MSLAERGALKPEKLVKKIIFLLPSPIDCQLRSDVMFAARRLTWKSIPSSKNMHSESDGMNDKVTRLHHPRLTSPSSVNPSKSFNEQSIFVASVTPRPKGSFFAQDSLWLGGVIPLRTLID